jgi:microcystin-dependent protein
VFLCYFQFTLFTLLLIQMKKRNLDRSIYLSVVLVIATFSCVSIVRAWTAPTSAPPGGSPSVSGVPTGSVEIYAGGSAPSGWLLCDGSAVSRATYADLFATISTIYGAGDGSTTFNLPDMRDRMVIGVSGTKSLGSSGGSETVNLSHSHTVNSHTHSDGSLSAASGGNHRHHVYWDIYNHIGSDITDTVENGTPDTPAGSDHGHRIDRYTDYDGTHTHDVSGSTGASSPGTNSQLSSAQSILGPYQAMYYIIKY